MDNKGFFCAAKWEELFLYLNHGNTNSCHHPIPHHIPLDELRENPSALHNTVHKMEMQQRMIDGKIVDECHMCWHMENENPDIVSDRMQKNITWKDSLGKLSVDPNHVPKSIEVVFDNLCNLTCSYCDSGQSSSWAGELKKNGPFNLTTDHRDLYQKVHIIPGSIDQEYLDAWNIWWKEIKHKVEILKISGGEPLTSPNFWKTLDEIKDEELDIRLHLNSNISIDVKYLKKLATYAKNFKIIKISASIDATGNIAEFTRAGLNYKQFISNVEWWCKNTPDNCVISLQSTVNIFGIWGLMDKVRLNLRLREKYPNKIISMYSTVVRFPEFQSILVLPRHIRLELKHKLESEFMLISSQLLTNERNFIYKSIQYLDNSLGSLTTIDHNTLITDLKHFTERYQKISNLTFSSIFPELFTNWLDVD